MTSLFGGSATINVSGALLLALTGAGLVGHSGASSYPAQTIGSLQESEDLHGGRHLAYP